MNCWGSGFIQIINYSSGGISPQEQFVILTENSIDLLTELSEDILTE